MQSQPAHNRNGGLFQLLKLGMASILLFLKIKLPRAAFNTLTNWIKVGKTKHGNTARPHGTRPYWTLILLGHCCGIGPKNFEIH